MDQIAAWRRRSVEGQSRRLARDNRLWWFEAPNTKSMGLDPVEIVLRTEETFNIDLPDDECSKVITVGDLYRLMLSKLELPYVQAKEIEVGNAWPESFASENAEFVVMVTT